MPATLILTAVTRIGEASNTRVLPNGKARDQSAKRRMTKKIEFMPEILANIGFF